MTHQCFPCNTQIAQTRNLPDVTLDLLQSCCNYRRLVILLRKPPMAVNLLEPRVTNLRILQIMNNFNTIGFKILPVLVLCMCPIQCHQAGIDLAAG